MTSIRRIYLEVGATQIGEWPTWSYPDDDGKTYLIPSYELLVSGTTEDGYELSRHFEILRFGVHRKEGSGESRVVGLANDQEHIIKSYDATYKVHSASSTERGAWQVFNDYLIHDGPDDIHERFATIGCIEICGIKAFNLFNDFILTLGGSTKSSRNDKLKEIGISGKMIIKYMGAQRPRLRIAPKSFMRLQ